MHETVCSKTGTMRKAVLERLESSDEGTFGILQIEDDEFVYHFYAGELPWRDNKSDVSCIPKGRYTALWTKSPRFGRHMYLIDKVENRAGIRLHAANFMGDDKKGFRKQVHGCIALGEKLGWLGGQKAVLVSRPAMRRFEDITSGKPFELEIK